MVDESVAMGQSAASVRVFQVQVPWNAFDLSSRHVAAAGRPPAGPEQRQFSLRSAILAVTVACILLAIVRVFGAARTFWGVFFVFGGMFSIGSGVACVRRGRASCGWPSVRGRITKAFIEDAGSDEYRSQIGYRFQVGGCDYAGDTIRFPGKTRSGMSNGYEIAREEIMRYPSGLEIDVFYDPTRPTMSVLERGATLRDGVLPCLVGLIFIAIGLAAFTFTGLFDVLP